MSLTSDAGRQLRQNRQLRQVVRAEQQGRRWLAGSGLESTLVGTVTVMASVLVVSRYLSDPTRFAGWLPQVQLTPNGEATFALRYRSDGMDRCSSARYLMAEGRHRVDWQLDQPVACSGIVEIAGDCSISQLRSTLTVKQTGSVAIIEQLHSLALRRLARTIEQICNLPPKPALPALPSLPALEFIPDRSPRCL
jgi:hypothetical protein